MSIGGVGCGSHLPEIPEDWSAVAEAAAPAAPVEASRAPDRAAWLAEGQKALARIATDGDGPELPPLPPCVDPLEAILFMLVAWREDKRFKTDKSHPGPPAGYGPPVDERGNRKQIPPDVQRQAEEFNRRTPPPQKGDKKVVMGSDGQIYVLCCEGQPEQKGVSAYQNRPLRDPLCPPPPPVPPPYV